MLFDERNPRSARFQLAKLAKHVRLLPDAGLIDVLAEVERLLRRLPRRLDGDQGELFGGGSGARGVADRAASASRVAASDALSLRYFSHVDDVPRATVGDMSGASIASSTRRATSTRAACRRRSTWPTSRRARCRVRRVRSHDLVIEPAPASHVAADRLLRQRRRPVHDSDALRRDARGRAKRRRGVTRAATRRCRRRTPSPPWEDGPRRALLPARRRRTTMPVRVQLSLAVHQPRAGAGRVCPRVVCAGSAAASRRPST